MAFPVPGTPVATTIASGTTAGVVLPAAIAVGELLFILLRTAVAGAHGYPGGWTELFDLSSDAADDQMSLAGKIADGSEDGTTVNVSQGSGKGAALSWGATGHEPTLPPELSTVATGASTTPNPTTCTPTGGAKDYLWTWLGGWEGEQTSPPASTPTNYGTTYGADSGTAAAVTTNCRVAITHRQNNAASEDPAAWTISASDDWTAYCMAVHPEIVLTNEQKWDRLGRVHHGPLRSPYRRDPFEVR